MRRGIPLLLILLAAAATQVGAEESRELAVGTWEGNGWVAHRFEAKDGAFAFLGTQTPDYNGSSAIGCGVFDSAGQPLLLMAGGFVVYGSLDDKLIVRAGPFRHESGSAVPFGATGGGCGLPFGPPYFPAGEYVLLVWGAGDADEWTHRLEATGDVTLLATRGGPEAHFLQEKDMAAGTFARKDEGFATVRANAALTHTLVVERRLVGVFADADALAEAVTIAGPGGVARCTCVWSALGGEPSLGPGAYALQASGVGGRVGPLLIAADVEMP